MDAHDREPVDPDVDLRDVDLPRREAAVLAAVAVGGVVGALGRYAAGRWWPTPAGQVPWTTFWVNVIGCALIGILLVLVSDVFTAHPLVRPLLGTGVLGGFTTFSAYAVDTEQLFAHHRPGAAMLNLAATVVAALLAVTVAARATRWACRRAGVAT